MTRPGLMLLRSTPSVLTHHSREKCVKLFTEAVLDLIYSSLSYMLMSTASIKVSVMNKLETKLRGRYVR